MHSYFKIIRFFKPKTNKIIEIGWFYTINGKYVL